MIGGTRAMIYVAGSGPAGVSCAAALLQAGSGRHHARPRSFSLSRRNAAPSMTLKNKPPEQWRGTAVGSSKGNLAPDPVGVRPETGIRFRLSLHGHRRACPSAACRHGDDSVAGPRRTQQRLGRGHLFPTPQATSTAGPSNSPNWNPIIATRWSRWTCRRRPTACRRSSRSTPTAPAPLAPSRQAAALLADMNRRAGRLNSAGIHFGRVRALAVRARPRRTNRPAASTAGFVSTAALNDLIFNSADALPRLMGEENFRYVPDCIVTRVEESAGGVRVFAKGRGSEKTPGFSGRSRLSGLRNDLHHSNPAAIAGSLRHAAGDAR